MNATRRPLAAVACALTLALGGCASFTAPEPTPPNATAVPPQPAGVAFGDPEVQMPDADECDGALSLRPPATMPRPGAMPRGSTMERIHASGRLVVGTDISSHPMSYRNPITGDVNGFDIDVAHWIAEAIFGDPDRIEYRILSDDARVRALELGQVDVVVKSMSITCERRESIDFSAPYFEAQERVLTYRNSGITTIADLAGKNVCATDSSTAIARVQRYAPEAHFVTTTSWADCLVMIQQGQVDAIASDEPILAGIASQDPWLQFTGPSLGTELYGVGISKEHPDLVRFVNGVLEQRRADGSWAASYHRWLQLLDDAYPPPVSYRADEPENP